MTNGVSDLWHHLLVISHTHTERGHEEAVGDTMRGIKLKEALCRVIKLSNTYCWLQCLPQTNLIQSAVCVRLLLNIMIICLGKPFALICFNLNYSWPQKLFRSPHLSFSSPPGVTTGMLLAYSLHVTGIVHLLLQMMFMYPSYLQIL